MGEAMEEPMEGILLRVVILLPEGFIRLLEEGTIPLEVYILGVLILPLVGLIPLKVVLTPRLEVIHPQEVIRPQEVIHPQGVIRHLEDMEDIPRLEVTPHQEDIISRFDVKT